MASCEAKFQQNDGNDAVNENNDDDDDDDDNNDDDDDNFDANDGECDDCSNSVDCMQCKYKYQQMCLKQGNYGEKSKF